MNKKIKTLFSYLMIIVGAILASFSVAWKNAICFPMMPSTWNRPEEKHSTELPESPLS